MDLEKEDTISNTDDRIVNTFPKFVCIKPVFIFSNLLGGSFRW